MDKATLAAGIEGPAIRQLPGLLHQRDDTHAHVAALLDPVAFVVSIWIAALTFDPAIGSQYFFVSLVVAMLTYPGHSRLHLDPSRLVAGLVAMSGMLMLLLYVFGWATRALWFFPRPVLVNWLWIAPATLVGSHLLFRYAAPLVLKRTQRCAIVGMNGQGRELARRIEQNPYTNLALEGFFDDRSHERLGAVGDATLLGRLEDLPAYVRRRQVHVIYLSLPMSSHERTVRLLDALRDTTASIYFVPDQFITELIQYRASTVVDIPVVSVRETPFVGLNGLLKRGSDIALSAVALAALSPLLVVLAGLVRATSSGPVIFKQRRYGLDGEEITVYKFRSMYAVDDGARVVQATRDDARVTAIGGFLRKTSLDELPQLVNVLQGRMSLVGPRPHAIAHNEMYRKVIKGYMLRHKVRPGITGWAQVNGLRGETETVDKMQARVRYDIDYLRNWSLRLDLYILARTAMVVLKDRNAY